MGHSRCPLFARAGTNLPVHPHPVRHTGEMDRSRDQVMVFDESYRGLSESILNWIEL